jgi:hypothetical protein
MGTTEDESGVTRIGNPRYQSHFQSRRFNRDRQDKEEKSCISRSPLFNSPNPLIPAQQFSPLSIPREQLQYFNCIQQPGKLYQAVSMPLLGHHKGRKLG